MPKQTASQIEKELAAAKAKTQELEKALEAQKQAEIAEQRAKRVKGIIGAWDKVTDELVKAGVVKKIIRSNLRSEKGLAIAETKFAKNCYATLGEILGIVSTEQPAQEGRRNKKLNDTQKAKIEEWVKEGLSVAEMNRKIYTNPDGTTYQRVSKHVKKVKG